MHKNNVCFIKIGFLEYFQNLILDLINKKTVEKNDILGFDFGNFLKLLGNTG